MYNLTGLQEAGTLSGIFVYGNQITNGILAISLMVALYFILMFSLLRYGFDVAVLTASTTSFILSMPLVYLDMLNIRVSYAFLIIASLIALFMYMTKQN